MSDDPFTLHIQEAHGGGWQYGISGRGGVAVFSEMRFSSREDAEMIGGAKVEELNTYAR